MVWDNGRMRLLTHTWWKKYWMETLVVGVILVFGAVFVYISVINHRRLMTFGWDLGFYDQLTYQLSRGEWPRSTFLGERPTLGARWSPILVLLAPIYWVWPRAVVLVIVQAVVAAVGAWPLWKVAGLRFKGKGKNGQWLGVAAVVAYLSFIGLQRAVFFDFHPDVLMAFLLAWLLYFVEAGKVRWAMAMAGLLLVSKETGGLLVAGVGMMEVLGQRFKVKGERSGTGGGFRDRLGLVLVALGVLGFGVTIYGMKAITGAEETSLFGYGRLGDTPIQVVESLVTKPWLGVELMVSPKVKLVTMGQSLASVGFLPLLVPTSLIPIGVQWAMRFWDESHRQAWTMNYHYSATLTPLLVYGAIEAIAGFRCKVQGESKRRSRQSIPRFFSRLCLILQSPLLLKLWPTGRDFGLTIGSMWLVGWSLGSMVYFHAPVFSALKPEFYRDPGWLMDDRLILKLIPDGAAVAAQNNLVPQLSAREKIYALPRVADALYVVVDLRSGQSEYNFAMGTEAEVVSLVEDLVARGKFERVASSGEVQLLRRVRY